ncbi:MAG: YgiQ family radical SAM protein [Elusimicrobiota bacterium]
MPFLPISKEEIDKLGWEAPDIVLITPDAYVDHPAFAMAVIGRYLEKKGFKVAILSAPDYRNPKEFAGLGKPKICFAISCGNMDSMINKYTHNKKPRNQDDFSPGGKLLNRPDKTLITYSACAKAAFKDVPVIVGGIEATMRRFVHYDYWSDAVKKPLILDSRADILVYGMGEKNAAEIAERLRAGKNIKEIRDLPGTSYALGASEKIPEDSLILPSFEEISEDKEKFLEMTKTIHENLNPFCSCVLVQKAGTKNAVINPPSPPLTSSEMDEIYDLPYERRPHPSYKEKIPAFETVKNSIISHRGCFGGCSFCSLGHHQGKFIQSRSFNSVKKEAEKLAVQNKGKAVISDLGAPSANMYLMGGKDFSICMKCKRESCLHPSVCGNLNYSHENLKKLLKEVSAVKGIKKVFIASGIRPDLALKDIEYVEILSKEHTSGMLKLAPEHTDPKILNSMKKPPIEIFLEFSAKFFQFSGKCAKEQYLSLYFISAYPGTDLKKAVETAVFLKKHNIKPLQINDFLPAPGEYATAVYYCGKDPLTKEPVYSAKTESERKMHRALMQYFKKENIPLILKALKLSGRTDLIPFFLR